MSMEQQLEIRQRLADAGIDYLLKTKNLTANSRSGHSGQLGIDLAAAVEYRFYVRKEDEARAHHVIGR